MVRVHEWKQFELQAREIFAKNPESTRLSLKQSTTTDDTTTKRNVKVLIKVTDNKRTITYQTTERFGAKRMGALTQWFTVRMASTENVKDEAALKQKLIH